MLQGHFGAAFLISGLSDGAASLSLLFIASQIQDLLMPFLITIANIEEARPATSSENKIFPLEGVYIPYSHSLFSSIVLSILAFLIPGSRRSKASVAAAVLSHWLLDLLSSLPELDVCFPFADCGKAGLGLFRYLIPSIVVESALVVLGFMAFLRRANSRKAARSVLFRLAPMVLFMVIVTVALPFTPLPKLDWTLTVQTFVTYGIFALVAGFGEQPLKKDKAAAKVDTANKND